MEGKNGKYIHMGGHPVRVSQDVYEVYYRMRRQERTLREKDARNRLVYYDAWDNGVTPGRDALADTYAPATEDVAIARITRDKLHRCLALMTEAERDLLHALFFEGKSVKALSRIMSIPYRTLGYRRDRALKKLKRLMER